MLKTFPSLPTARVLFSCIHGGNALFNRRFILLEIFASLELLPVPCL